MWHRWNRYYYYYYYRWLQWAKDALNKIKCKWPKLSCIIHFNLAVAVTSHCVVYRWLYTRITILLGLGFTLGRLQRPTSCRLYAKNCLPFFLRYACICIRLVPHFVSIFLLGHHRRLVRAPNRACSCFVRKIRPALGWIIYTIKIYDFIILFVVLYGIGSP